MPKDEPWQEPGDKYIIRKFDSLNFDLSFEADSLRALDLERSIEETFTVWPCKANLT